MNPRFFIPTILLALVSPGLTNAQNTREAETVITSEAGKLRFATFNDSKKMVWDSLKEGVNIYGTTDRYQWKQVPPSLRGIRFLVLPHHLGVLDFSVKSGGMVYMVTSTRWNGGGNSSGDWKDEVLLEKDLRRRGWRKLRGIKKLTTNDTGEMAVFYRHCKAGESHRIRTEKYAAPMLLIR